MNIKLVSVKLENIEKHFERLNYLLEQVLYAYGIPYDHVLDPDLQVLNPEYYEYDEEAELVSETVAKILHKKDGWGDENEE